MEKTAHDKTWNAVKSELAMLYFKLLTTSINLYVEAEENYDNQTLLN
jgi:cation transport regulator ChaB